MLAFLATLKHEGYGMKTPSLAVCSPSSHEHSIDFVEPHPSSYFRIPKRDHTRQHTSANQPPSPTYPFRRPPTDRRPTRTTSKILGRAQTWPGKSLEPVGHLWSRSSSLTKQSIARLTVLDVKYSCIILVSRTHQCLAHHKAGVQTTVSTRNNPAPLPLRSILLRL